MKIKLITTIAAVVFSAVPVIGAPTMGGSLKIYSTTTNKEISTVRVGQEVRLAVTINNLNLIANKDASFSYALTVLPTGITNPISISGKFFTRATLPASEGGAAKTISELAPWAGPHSASEIVIIPDSMPTGKATVSVSLAGKSVGAITLSKTLTITL